MVTAIVNEYKNNCNISCYNDVWIERHKTVDQLFKRLTEGKEVHDIVELEDNEKVDGTVIYVPSLFAPSKFASLYKNQSYLLMN